ncbi:MAG: hypothetical protein KME17_08450 [Cyanosarcina radialis HA8281-LM2]|jgi:chromosome segregation ATPase|nr:hypothetical protein [Cyanosarcina radialis HA8281-LM2]
MAKLSNEAIAKIFYFQQQLLEKLDEATATNFQLLEQYGETAETLPELDELQRIVERANSYYTRFYVTLRQLYEAQPTARRDSLELLVKYMDEAEVTIAAIQASLQEIKRNWNLP